MADADSPGKHVLVVNDTEEVLELFRDIIEGMGHRMTALSYAPDDLAEVAKIKPDLAIVDLLFGAEGTGLQLVQKMRMHPPTAKIPVVICTGDVKHAREQEGWLAANGINMVLKPFEVDKLELAITKAFRLSEITR